MRAPEAAEAALVARARSGDGEAFEQLVGPYRRELHVHCYRVLGSVTDAEDALQESLTAAWRGLDRFEARASVRTWLYRITTNRCLNLLRASRRRPPARVPELEVEPPEPTRLGEVTWLEPYPDTLLAGLADSTAGPEARYEQREAISLAFVIALQLLPPRQRVALILSDVLDFSAREVAELLDTTEQAVYGALKRARATLARRQPAASEPPPLPDSPAEQQVLGHLLRAWEAGDTGALVALMTDDVWLRMPPNPLEYQGRERLTRWFATVVFREGRSFRLVPTRANGQPAFGVYRYDPSARSATVFDLVVITLAGGRISAITRFEHGVIARFGLPPTLPA